MTNSRRGFLASILALLPFTRNAFAGDDTPGTGKGDAKLHKLGKDTMGTVRFYNNTTVTAMMRVYPVSSIAPPAYSIVTAGGVVSSKSTSNKGVVLQAIDLNDNTITHT